MPQLKPPQNIYVERATLVWRIQNGMPALPETCVNVSQGATSETIKESEFLARGVFAASLERLRRFDAITEQHLWRCHNVAKQAQREKPVKSSRSVRSKEMEHVIECPTSPMNRAAWNLRSPDVHSLRVNFKSVVGAEFCQALDDNSLLFLNIKQLTAVNVQYLTVFVTEKDV